ncbi:hypothetical protein [Cricetibacter osteomyelitidis]|uniref:hypothetical protein n=1 Tax=Cricetibacter osteomyelitidis TaxID=1521931 RepID=UPI00104359B9|nr:hypothetical protein [Cricetibacter osteomyelitidis]
MGTISQKMGYEDGSLEKVILHGINGAIAAAAGKGDILTGAASGAAGEVINSQIAEALAKHTDLSPEARKSLQNLTALGIGAAVGNLVGGNSNSTAQGANLALNAEMYNRQLHPSEQQRIKELANGDKEKERRLTVAACALVHCSAQISKDSQGYTEAKAMEELGNTPEYLEERLLLQRQRIATTMQDDFGYQISTQVPMFKYSIGDSLSDTNQKYAVTTRIGGAMQAVAGGATVVGSVGATKVACEATVGLGCGLAISAGSTAATYGADHFNAGVNTLINGKQYNTYGAQLLSDLTGIDASIAELIYGLPQVGNSNALGKLSPSKLPVVGKTVGYENQTSKITVSSGAENVALYPRLKEQLKQENLQHIVSKHPVLEHAAFGKGNLTINGTFSRQEIERLAYEWIGDGAIHNSNGGLTSMDGTRRYRPANRKLNSSYAETGVQANFERGFTNEKGKFISDSNLHINIKE